ncbi:MAG: hypothetical protein GQ527_10560 [Bacteroidales bacterium]|nr:hypothetical protein [Bacteroidales bacterium]
MSTPDKYNDIRPYNPSEVPPAIDRMLVHPHFQLALDYLFPKEKHQEIFDGLKLVKSNYKFQEFFMHQVINRIMELSSDGLTLHGQKNLINNGPSVLIGNHRDILLDSAILQVVLVDLLKETSEITFGSNLMLNDFIVDFGKVNRMFVVQREGSPRELLEHSKRLSSYMHYTIQEKKVSAWIAQRKGRTKDGLDKTDPAVLKMLTIFDRKNPIDAFKAINILPVVISYEWEPCDFYKVRELYLTPKQAFKKAPDEDFNSVILGITEQKGRINMAFGKPVNQFIEENKSELSKQNIHQQIASFIDGQVYKNYQLYPNNYLAYDLLFNEKKFSDHYTNQTKLDMEQKIEALFEFMQDRSAGIKDLYLKLYANPLIQKMSIIE